MSIITAGELKDWIGFPSMPADIDLFESTITAAEKAISDYWGRTLSPADDTTASKVVDGSVATLLVPEFAGAVVVEQSTNRVDWAEVSATVWTEPDDSLTRYMVCSDLPFSRWVRLTAAWGLGPDLAETAKVAVLMKASRLWKRKASPTGIEGVSEWGIIRVSHREDSDIVSMLQGSRRVDVTDGFA